MEKTPQTPDVRAVFTVFELGQTPMCECQKVDGTSLQRDNEDDEGTLRF